jgi:hypothetical protein
MLMHLALYCHFFPRMDPDRALDSRLESSVWATTNDILVEMEERFKIPNQWLDFLVRLHSHYKKERAKLKAVGGSPGSTSSDGSGGLRDYSDHFETDHKEFGSVTGTWNSKPVNRDDLKLQHEPDLENRSEATSPAMVYKSEGTPSAWTSVNAKSPGTELSETPVAQTQNQAFPSRGQYTNPVPDYAARIPTYNSHGVQPLQSPMQSHAAPAPTYYSSSASHAMYRPPHLATGSGSTHAGPETYWSRQQEQPSPQIPPNPQEMNDILASGQQSLDNTDIWNFQCAEDAIGDPYSSYSVTHSWTEQIPPLSHGQITWNNQAYDGSQSQVGPK